MTERLKRLRTATDENLIKEMRHRSNLDDRGRACTFDNFDHLEKKEAAWRFSFEWVQAYKKSGAGSGEYSGGQLVQGILFYGPTGVGKTHLACAIANSLISEMVFTYFLPTVRIPKQDSEEIERLSDPEEYPVLILDDLGAEKGTERALECLYSIIDGRIWKWAPMIITTNFEPEKLKSRLNSFGPGYGSRMLSRLRECCRFVPVGGKDMR